MSFWNDEKKKEFKRQYEEYCSGSMGPEDKNDLKNCSCC